MPVGSLYSALNTTIALYVSLSKKIAESQMLSVFINPLANLICTAEIIRLSALVSSRFISTTAQRIAFALTHPAHNVVVFNVLFQD